MSSFLPVLVAIMTFGAVLYFAPRLVRLELPPLNNKNACIFGAILSLPFLSILFFLPAQQPEQPETWLECITRVENDLWDQANARLSREIDPNTGFPKFPPPMDRFKEMAEPHCVNLKIKSE